jgi:SAM-dependent methyltransferase
LRNSRRELCKFHRCPEDIARVIAQPRYGPRKALLNIMRAAVPFIKRRVRSLLESTAPGYRFLLRRDYHVRGPLGRPRARWHNAVLRTCQQRDDAIEQVKTLGLPLVSDAPKNWDCLAALDCILRNTTKRGRVLDAGAETYSRLLPWLCLYGYGKLDGINIVFDKVCRLGPITYKYGDITSTDYDFASFDAISCLSVIEHGVDLRSYFREMARILKPGGVLITSTDYWETPIHATGEMFGAPVRVFTRGEILLAMNLAAENGLLPTQPIDLACDQKVVHWKEVDLDYTFLVFCLRKSAD